MTPSIAVLVRRVLLGGLLLSGTAFPATAQAGRITVFNAGSLARPLREALRLWAATRPGIEVAQENAGSLESARKLTELHKIPDVIALADEAVFPGLLMPAHVTWYATFARNEMVLAYTDRSTGAAEITGANWATILLRPGVRTGRSDPSLDPNGYRTLMVAELEERRAGVPGLAARLRAAMPARYIRPKEADLVALLQAGELDYAWSYRSMAEGAGLKWVDLPPEVDLGDPERDTLYAKVSVKVATGGPRSPLAVRSPQSAPSPQFAAPPQSAVPDSLTIRGAPILYALAIPVAAPNAAAARSFVEWLLGPDGRAVLLRNGFNVLDRPLVHGEAPAWLHAPVR